MSVKKHSIHSLVVREAKVSLKNTPHRLPIFATSSFDFDHIEQSIDIFKGEAQGHVYSRYGNPTIDAVSEKIANLEAYGTGLQSYGFMTSSGMSAISTIIYALLKNGDQILTQSDLYGGTTELFQKIVANAGIISSFDSMEDMFELESKLSNNRKIKLIFLETPTNPTLKCLDIAAICKIAKKYGVYTCVDNTFCTPLIQQPLSKGVDFVIHSTTKYLNGHGNSISGIIIGHDSNLKTKVWETLKLIGSTSNPWDAWLVEIGLKTLSLRMQKHSDNAMSVASYLDSHPRVTKVNYTGLPSHTYHDIARKQMTMHGGMLSFEIDGDMASTLKVINNMKFCTLAPTLGDVDTLVLHPATSSHLNIEKNIRLKNGITDSLIRLSVGIEHVDDIIEDLEQALK